jgi:hypothetical protein
MKYMAVKVNLLFVKMSSNLNNNPRDNLQQREEKFNSGTELNSKIPLLSLLCSHRHDAQDLVLKLNFLLGNKTGLKY